MGGYFVKRILATMPVMLVVATFVFSLLRLTPGDPAAIIAGDYANPRDVVQIRQKLGLDEPLYRQFAIWMGQLLRGDLGTSIFSGLPVTQLITQRLEPTLALTLLTLIIAIGLAIPLGTLAAYHVGTWIDRGVMIFAVLGFSLPVFWLGFILIYAFAMQLSMLPVQGYAHLSQGLLPFLKHLILPALTLGLVYTALIARMTRASMLEVLQEDYIRTACAKGARSWSIVIRHALKNAALPVVTIVGVCVSTMSTLIGRVIGLVSGYHRRLDAMLMRVMDGLMAIPGILLAIALMASMRASVRNVIVALIIPEIPRVVRLVRALVLSLREQPFVEAMQAAGAGIPRILFRHIMPNTLAPVLVQATYICASAVIVEAYLSFLGAGTPPNVPSWGNIMAEGRSYVQLAFWIIFFPGLFVAMTVLAINLVGDGLRDTLDPKLARRM